MHRQWVIHVEPCRYKSVQAHNIRHDKTILDIWI